MCIYTYIYIERERERGYIYRERERERGRDIRSEIRERKQHLNKRREETSDKLESFHDSAILMQLMWQCVRAAKEMDSKSIGLCPQGFESPRCRLCSFKRFLFHRPCSRSPCFLFFPLCHISHPLPVSVSLQFSIYPSFSLHPLLLYIISLSVSHLSLIAFSLCIIVCGCM